MQSKPILSRSNALSVAGTGLAWLPSGRPREDQQFSRLCREVPGSGNVRARAARPRRLFPARWKNRGVVRLYDRDQARVSSGSLT